MRQYTDHCVNRKLEEAIERWIKSEQPMTQLTLTFPIMILQRKQGQSWVGNGVFSTDNVGQNGASYKGAGEPSL